MKFCEFNLNCEVDKSFVSLLKICNPTPRQPPRANITKLQKGEHISTIYLRMTVAIAFTDPQRKVAVLGIFGLKRDQLHLREYTKVSGVRIFGNSTAWDGIVRVAAVQTN